MPLLGATIIAVMAFYPIFASVEDAGEYCRTLFSVAGLSLLASWVISMTVTPLQCIAMLPALKQDEAAADPYGSGFYRVFQGLLEKAMRFRRLTSRDRPADDRNEALARGELPGCADTDVQVRGGSGRYLEV